MTVGSPGPAMEFETHVGVLIMMADPNEPTPVFDALMAELGDETVAD